MTAAHTRLERAATKGHTALVCAPAGSGKTVLVADWLRRRSGAGSRIGWVGRAELAADNALWRAVAAALGLPPIAPADAIPDTPVAEAAAVLAALSDAGPAVLVLDDAHLISDPLALSGLEYFVEHAPATLTIVVIGRYDPPIRWHALELAGLLTRLGAPELALDEAHTAALLAQHDCRLTDSELTTVHELTCGWAGLVRIAALHLAAHAGDRATAIAALARGPRAVADFLVGELLTALAPDALDFLLATAVPTSFCADLATDLAGPTAPRTLDQLLRNNFPLEVAAHDGTLWYTYHPMLRTYLLAETARTDPGRAVERHRACARWFTAAGSLADALTHVLAEPERPALPEFVREHGPRMVFDGNGDALFARLDQLAWAAGDTFVLLLRAADALERADLVQAAALRDLLDLRAPAASAFAEPDLLWPFAAAVVCGIDVATGRAGGPPPPFTPTGHPDLDSYIALHLATAHTFGPHDANGGERALRHALALSEHAGLPRLTLHALTRLALAAGLNGSLALMHERAAQAVAFAEEHRLHDATALAHARAMVALMSYLRVDDPLPPVEENHSLTTQLDGSTAPASGWHAHVLAQLFDLDTTGDPHTATDRLRGDMHHLLDESPLPATTGGLLIQVSWALLRVRWPEAARRLLDRASDALGRLPEITLVEAALAEYGHRSATTVELVETLLAEEDSLHPVTAIHARLLYAAACHRLQRPVTYDALRHALSLAHTDRLIRPFLDVPGTVDLLDRFVGRFGYLDDFADAIRQRSHARTRAHAPSLTNTEVVVLRQLPSGMTTHSIADDMGVSINTVKTHLRGIYHKLGVRTRADAIASARNYGLI
ncbi:LuxR C-terminal-related transcriptional regulator [Nocardia blacklockiae]|uniref:LuxR C-terminal-related transcriptional regulator n=1 Tax=Nocardia blacklockiae TaxID=480036 RepID=UPI0018941328|nr:LuxR C-terminal-related transcriptional regulator [Nocardia blacklockiae]MBF6173832.1 hypothetical protein [Nocardia blacklockiae]